MKIVGTLVVLALAAVGAARFLATSSKTTSDFINVMADKRIDLGQVPNVPGDNMKIYVNRNSVSEEVINGIKIRSASVVYHFVNPLEIQGEKVHYVYRAATYHCESKAFSHTGSLLYGEAADHPLFSVEDSKPEIAKPGTSALAEVEYVCDLEVKKSDEPKIGPVKPFKSIDI